MKLEINKNVISENGLGMTVRGGGLGTSGWVAKITGTDEKYGFARAFCKKDFSELSGSRKSGTLVFELSGAGVYEFRNLCYNSSKEFSGFFVIDEENEEIFEIEKSEVVDYL